MKSEYADCEVEDVPVSPLLAEGWRNRYGGVPGLAKFVKDSHWVNRIVTCMF